MVVKPSTYRRWTAAELKKVIAMLQHPDFDSKDIDPDLHQRMAKAVDVLGMYLVHTKTYWFDAGLEMEQFP